MSLTAYNKKLRQSATLDFLMCRKFSASYSLKISISFEVQHFSVADTTSEICYMKSRPTPTP